ARLIIGVALIHGKGGERSGENEAREKEGAAFHDIPAVDGTGWSLSHDRLLRRGHDSYAGPVITRTAAPVSRPSRRRARASSASSSGSVSTVVTTGTFGARARNSSPSARVRFATERIERS